MSLSESLDTNPSTEKQMGCICSAAVPASTPQEVAGPHLSKPALNSNKEDAALQKPRLEDFAVEGVLIFLSLGDLPAARLVCRQWCRLALQAALHNEERITLLGKWVGMGSSEGFVFHMKMTLDLHMARKKGDEIPVEGAIRWRLSSIPYAYVAPVGTIEYEWVKGKLLASSRLLEFQGFGRSGVVGQAGVTGLHGQFRCNAQDCRCLQYITTDGLESIFSTCETCHHPWSEHGIGEVLGHIVRADEYRMTLPSLFRADAEFS
eukprot:RCo014145